MLPLVASAVADPSLTIGTAPPRPSREGHTSHGFNLLSLLHPAVGGGPKMLVPILLYAVLFPDSIVAQAATDAGPWLTGVNLGLAGIFLWAFASGRIVAQSTHAKCEDKLAAAEVELRERNQEARDTLIPTLVRATDLLARYLDRQSNTPPPKGRA